MLKLKIMNENIPLRKNNFIINNSQNPNLSIASNLNLINDVPRNNFSILNNFLYHYYIIHKSNVTLKQ